MKSASSCEMLVTVYHLTCVHVPEGWNYLLLEVNNTGNVCVT